MKNVLVSAAVFATVSCMAQTPNKVKVAFASNFPGVTVKKWDKEDGKYEANFIQNDKTISATFDRNGTLEETETNIKVVELPASVASFVKTKYNGATIKEASVIVNSKGEKMYEAEVKGKDLLFDLQGKFLKEEAD